MDFNILDLLTQKKKTKLQTLGMTRLYTMYRPKCAKISFFNFVGLYIVRWQMFSKVFGKQRVLSPPPSVILLSSFEKSP